MHAMQYAHGMSGHQHIDKIASSRVLVAVILVTLCVTYAIAVAHGVVTIDVARDLYWGQRIVRGEAFPLSGPPVGTITLLGPIWYYVVAAVLAVSGSLTSFFFVMGLLAASKFALAYVVGRRWLGPPFGTSLAVATAVPGIGSYQLLGVGHPWFVEAMLWLAAWCTLRMRAEPGRLRWAAGLGLASALAVHAHPTAIVLLPWVLIAIITLPASERWRAMAVTGLAVLLILAPRLLGHLSPSLAAQSAADNATGPSGIGGSLLGIVGIAENVIWTQAKHMFDGLFPRGLHGAGLAALAWSAVLLSTAVGLVIAMNTPRLRSTLFGALASLAWTLCAVALLRNHTPFYMTFVVLVPLSVVLAVAWTALLGSDRSGRRALWLAVLLVVASLHLAVFSGLVKIAQAGRVNSYLPLHSNMQDVSTNMHSESVVSAPTRDALARWLCANPGPVSLHGDLAAAFDMSLHIETDIRCPRQRRRDDVGGGQTPHVALPLSVWQQSGVTVTQTIGAYGLVPAHRVLGPPAALPEAPGQRYPPRLDLMLSAARTDEWTFDAALPADEIAIVSSLLPTSPLFAVAALANGRRTRALTKFANTAVFRCQDCGSGTVQWQFNIRGGLPQTTSIASVVVARASAKLAE